jgi:tetratricopeptide (TPR) repeat protein
MFCPAIVRFRLRSARQLTNSTTLRKITTPCLLFFLFLMPLSGLAQDQFRPLYLSGKVVLPDGSPPPEPAILELRCGDQRQPQYYTDSKGYFNFRVGGEPSHMVADSQRTLPGAPVGASGSDRSHVSLTNCELEAALPGYTSSKIFLGRRSVFENSNVGTIVLTPVAEGEGSFISMNTLSAPPDARKAFDKAGKELAKKRPNAKNATKELQKALEVYPQFAAAWNLLGKTRTMTNDLEGARKAFQKAIESDPKFVPPRLSLALLDLKEQRAAEAANMAGSVIKLLPELAEAHYYNAIAQFSLGNLSAAETSIHVIEKTPQAKQYPRIHFMLGNILTQRGEIQQAAVEFRQFLEMEPSSRAAEAVRKQLGKLN